MYLCTTCNEFSASEFYDRYDDEIYIKCCICGKIQTETLRFQAEAPMEKICIGKK